MTHARSEVAEEVALAVARGRHQKVGHKRKTYLIPWISLVSFVDAVPYDAYRLKDQPHLPGVGDLTVVTQPNPNVAAPLATHIAGRAINARSLRPVWTPHRTAGRVFHRV